MVVVKIHEVQGDSGDSPLLNQTVTVEAIVVGDYQATGSGQLAGFFIQEEDADVDNDADTSEGLFVFCGGCTTPVGVGDKVQVTGSVSEYFGMTQISATSAGSVTILSTGNDLPTPATVELPVPGVRRGNLANATADINAYFERFEGMLVTFPDTLTVSEYFELARYGQVILTEGGREQQFTNDNRPSVRGYTNHQIELAARTIILDDTDNRQNRPVDSPNTPYFHPQPGLSTTNYFRGGDTISDLTGVLHWSFNGQSGEDAWRIRPVVEEFDYEFTPVNLRPEAPEIQGNLTVASFNVLNYFLTIDTTSSNSSGHCGPTLDMDCRGADSVDERVRQRNKILAALTAIDADVFGFMEMENTPNVEPLEDLVTDLPGYDYIDTGVIGGDAIRVGIIYKTTTVAPVGDFALLDSTVDPRFDSSRNRPALAQTFEEIATGEQFTVVVNHLKSKGCGTPPNQATGVEADAGDGQSCWNPTRTAAAKAMAEWLANDPTGSGDPDFLIIGDLNAYAMEDPIKVLKDAGYTDLVAEFDGAYGYVFDGQLGYLDHALANPSLLSQVTDTVMWHINADEIPLFDYNDTVRDAGEAAFEEESDVLPLYEANEFRSSDHDPVIIGLTLGSAPIPTDIYLTTTAPGKVDGVQFKKNDVLVFSNGDWELAFEGAQAGLPARADINAVYFDPAENEFLMSFKQNKIGIPGLSPIMGQDIVSYNDDSDTWSVFFDGSDVGLDTAAERIDGLHVLPGSAAPIDGCTAGYLLISLHGAGRVPAYGGGTIKAGGEDVLGFCATNVGDETAGFWFMVLDGSEEEMKKNVTDSISADSNGTFIYLTTRAGFEADSAVGGHSMVYVFNTLTNEFSGPLFSAPDEGLNKKVDGLHTGF